MNAPDDTVIPFPRLDRNGLRWHALSLDNAARAAAEALATSRQLAAALLKTAQAQHELAAHAATFSPDLSSKAELCRTLGRTLAAL